MKFIKRMLGLALSAVLLAGLLMPASAASISIDQAQTVTVVNDETPVILQFTPAKSGYYGFYSYDSQGYDPCGYIMDAGLELLVQGDDTEDSMDFFMSCYMTAGNTYFLAATCYSGSAKYTVRITALAAPTSIAFDQSAYTGSIGQYLYPQICFYPSDSVQESVTMTSSNEQVVHIGTDGDFILGTPGTATVTATSASGLTATCTVTVKAPSALSLDTPWTLDAALGQQYLSFTAPADGWYGIYSQGDEIDPWGAVFDATMEGIIEDDESLPDHNFFTPVYLEKNELCYFGLGAYNETGTAQITLQKLEHATAIQLPGTLTGYVNTGCWLNPVYEPQVAIPEALTWSSSNQNVVTVDDTGAVNFLKPGTATITVTSETGKTDSVTVTVLSAPSGYTAWGNCGPNLQWQLSSTGILTVTGSGEMYDLYDNNSHWDSYYHLIKQVILPEGLTSIGYGAFMYCYNLTQISIPSSVRHIGNAAFSSCSSLTSIILPEALERLGALAFEYCYALKQIELPNSLKRISKDTFIFCTELSSVTLPDKLISIGDNAFAFCPIEQIQLPDTLKTLGYGAFAGTGLKQITLPQGLTELRDYALINCALEEVTIPASVTKMGSGLFIGNALHTLRFLGDAPQFDEYTFDSMSLTAYYPAGNSTWTEDVLQNYGGQITWISEGTPGVNLSGTVTTGADGDTTIELIIGDEVFATAIVCAKDGTYSFENVAAGTYILKVSKANHVARQYTVTVASDDLTQDVKIHLIGDIDGNGKVNTGDVAKLNAHLKGTSKLKDEYQLECANVNGGSLNMGDTAALYAHVRGTKKLY